MDSTSVYRVSITTDRTPLTCSIGLLVGLRCRLSPSPATGLVGMPENAFLSDYFGCVGFLRFTTQRYGYQVPLGMRSCQALVLSEAFFIGKKTPCLVAF